MNELVFLLGARTHWVFLSELCWGKAMVAYAKPQQRKKEESERLRGERDQIKFIDLNGKVCSPYEPRFQLNQR